MSRERYPRVPKINMEVGHNYKFDVPASSKGKKATKFQGKVIQIAERFITLRHILGFNESFLKVDKAADYKNIALSIYEEAEYKDNCICKIEDHVPKQLKRKLHEMVS